MHLIHLCNNNDLSRTILLVALITHVNFTLDAFLGNACSIPYLILDNCNNIRIAKSYIKPNVKLSEILFALCNYM